MRVLSCWTVHLCYIYYWAKRVTSEMGLVNGPVLYWAVTHCLYGPYWATNPSSPRVIGLHVILLLGLILRNLFVTISKGYTSPR